MNILQAIFLGIVQGLTEFLPISSSAHLRILGGLFLEDPGATFTAVTQIGTEAAVLIYFRHDILRIIKSWFRSLPVGPWKKQVPSSDPDARMGWIVILGTIPIVILGLLLEDAIDSVFRNLYLTALMLALFAIFLGLADRLGKKSIALQDMTIRDGIILGFAQAMALIPGVSRSGGTITVGLAMGYTRSAAARISFLLAIPAVLGSGFYRLITDGTGGTDISPLALTVATFTAFVVGYGVIVWFLRLVETKSYLMFVIYRIVLAIVLVMLLWQGIIAAY